MRRSHESKNVYRTRAETAALKNAVLDAWSDGEDGCALSQRLQIDRGYLDVIVRRARAKGDPRAERRYQQTDSYGWRRALHGSLGDRVWSMHKEGKSAEEIAIALGRTPFAVISEISRQQLDRTGKRRTAAEFRSDMSTLFRQRNAERIMKARARHANMRAAYANGISRRDIAATYGVSRFIVYRALRST